MSRANVLAARGIGYLTGVGVVLAGVFDAINRLTADGVLVLAVVVGGLLMLASMCTPDDTNGDQS